MKENISSLDSLPDPENNTCYFFTPSVSSPYVASLLLHVLLLLPLSILVLFYGLQQWKTNPSSSSVNHSAVFTYHMAAMELAALVGCLVNVFAVNRKDFRLLEVGNYFVAFTWNGENFFNLLTCVERYLAVVHPVTYRNLRTRRGIRLRNAGVGCVWLLCLVETAFMDYFYLYNLCLLSLSFVVVSFCSLSVLQVLLRPGPGETGGTRERVDQSKTRAFYTIVAILGVLVFRVFGDLVWEVFNMLYDPGPCDVMVWQVWSDMPSSLVLPLLFVLRHASCTGL